MNNSNSFIFYLTFSSFLNSIPLNIHFIYLATFNFKTSIMENELFDFGMIGLGVMGSNLLQNMAGHGFKVIGYDKDKQKTDVLESLATKEAVIKGVNTIEA